MVEYQKLTTTDDDETNINDSSVNVYIDYKRRWFYLFVVCLAQISNAWLWINFSPIANISADYFKVSYDAINWLSLIYMITTIPLTLPSTWIIDRLGIRAGMLIGTGLNFLGSAVRCLSAISGLSTSARFPLVMTGQFLCSFAQTFILFIPTKFSFVWFTEKQRSLANSIAIGSNFFGVLISSILTPIIVRTSDQIPLMLYLSVIPALLALCLSLAIRSAEPPTPSCRAVVHISQPFLLAIKRLFFSKSYMILFFGCGIVIGCFNTLSTLVEQMMCPFGYDNVTVGLCLGWFIGAGSFGSLVFGYFTDRTGRLEEISKILYATSSIAYIALVLFIKNSLSRYFIYFAFGFVGFVSLPISPLSMDLSLECVYPIPEATATGINVMASQIIGIIMVIIFPKMGRPLNAEEVRIETCSNDLKSRIAVLDYTVPLYVMTLLMVAVTMLYFCLFKCPYARRRRH